MKQIEVQVNRTEAKFQCEVCKALYLLELRAITCEKSHTCSQEIIKYSVAETGYGGFSITAKCYCNRHNIIRYIGNDKMQIQLKDIFEIAE